MSDKNALLKNTIVMTLASVIIRGAGMVFQVYLSKSVGAAGMGLYNLILSVSVFASTFAVSGIRFATTRLASEEMCTGPCGVLKRAVNTCMVYALFFGTLAMALLSFGADFIGNRLVGDSRSVLSLRMMALSLPFLAMSSVYSGFFIAAKRASAAAAVQLTEQAIRIIVSVAALRINGLDSLEMACTSIVFGGTAAECASFVMYLLLYRMTSVSGNRELGGGHNKPPVYRRMLGIALPLAVSAYARTALVTVQNLLIPGGLASSGLGRERAMAAYGMIDGMVLPVIAFPSVLFYSIADLIVPELTEEQMRGRNTEIDRKVNLILHRCLEFSLFFAGAFLAFGSDMGRLIYDSEEAGRYISAMALFVPFYYMDAVTDGMLRGLGQQMHSMRYNIVDSVLSILLIILMLPRAGVCAYIMIIYFSECFNFMLSFGRLCAVSRVRLGLNEVLRDSMAAVIALCSAKLICRTAVAQGSLPGIALCVIFAICMYYCILSLPERVKCQKFHSFSQ
ncbi:MAG: oligosaccharide flippase family protein [Oscillospiraceae bacterium]|nr:oligosaccharide flippase family protein [Oscillospiraceae bacterium]